MFEVTIHIPGLLELAEALKQMSSSKGQEGVKAASVVENVPVSPAPVSAQMPVSQPAPPPTAAVQTPQTMPTAPVTPPSVMPQTPPVVGAVPTSTPTYTLDDLARAAMTLMDSGRQLDLQKLLADFGVEALPALPPAQYGAFATALRGMGAQI